MCGISDEYTVSHETDCDESETQNGLTLDSPYFLMRLICIIITFNKF